MATRLGEIILISLPELTCELYPAHSAVIGSMISIENSEVIGIIHQIVSVAVDEGKSTQALGDSTYTDATLKQHYPHLSSSIRTLAKIYSYDGLSPLTINQGVYATTAGQELENAQYWNTVARLSLPTLRAHVEWLKQDIPTFDLTGYIRKLSQIEKSLAWKLYLTQEAA
ncbi:hypothetical protein KA517_01205 [Candidatus Gracilibacteria bacterium]|nr:hypothetical protein [Candidatus Gracilibacteria bacterium]MBP7057204.1 hypothetical protein [Candidatus Gracilibacteria bacterium]